MGKTTGHHYSSAHHRTLQKSSTLNRRFVAKPTGKPTTITTQRQQQPKITSAALRAAKTMQRRQQLSSQISRANLKAPASIRPKTAPQQAKSATNTAPATPPPIHPTAKLASARAAARKAPPPRHLTAQELKDRAIQQALRKVATMGEDQTTQEQMAGVISKKRHFWQKRKLAIAISMAILSIGLLGYLVHLNLPDLSVKVAAMQTGIDNVYPSYIPKNYRLNGLVAEKNGKISMNFSGKGNAAFTLTAEKSSWDSSAVLSNFVIPEWGDEYALVKGQGLTIYIYQSNAAWVNGGILYLISDDHGGLTKQQLHDIAVSL